MNYITFASTASAKKVGAQSPMKMPKRSVCALFRAKARRSVKKSAKPSAVSPFLMFQMKMEPMIEMKPSAASAIAIKSIVKFSNCKTVNKNSS